jgi:threonine synthase
LKTIWQYQELLPSMEDQFKISLGEGQTPLIRSRHIGPSHGMENLYFKLEMLNPTGSYKDRFAACAVADLLSRNVNFCLATSSGNTGAALSAYCAAADITCFLAIVDGAPQGKLQQMQVYGGNTLMIKDFGKSLPVTEAVFEELNDLANKYDSGVLISAYKYSPVGMAGVQTISYELAEQLPSGIDHVFSPSGGGGLTLAVIKGFNAWEKRFAGFKVPRIHCVQPEGNNTIVACLRSGYACAKAIPFSTTTISGLQVPGVIDGHELVPLLLKTGGTGHLVKDDSVYECQAQLATCEGIYCEPAGATALAGVISALQKGEIKKDDFIVCLITGHGFKDAASGEKLAQKTGGKYFSSLNESLHYIKSNITQNQLAYE